jgi:hypothetical protein
MKSLISVFQSMTTPSTSRHALRRRIRRRWFASTSSTLHHVNFFDVVDTSSRHEHLPEIKIRLWKASEFTILIFEITFFLKTDKLKSAFKLRLTSPGRKLWPILVYCILKANKLFKFNFLKTVKVQTNKIQTNKI